MTRAPEGSRVTVMRSSSARVSSSSAIAQARSLRWRSLCEAARSAVALVPLDAA
jgi:hypothetical protein